MWLSGTWKRHKKSVLHTALHQTKNFRNPAKQEERRATSWSTPDIDYQIHLSVVLLLKEGITQQQQQHCSESAGTKIFTVGPILAEISAIL